MLGVLRQIIYKATQYNLLRGELGFRLFMSD